MACYHCVSISIRSVSTSRLVATSTLYIIPYSEYVLYGQSRTFADITGQVFAQILATLFVYIVVLVFLSNYQSFYKHLLWSY